MKRYLNHNLLPPIIDTVNDKENKLSLRRRIYPSPATGVCVITTVATITRSTATIRPVHIRSSKTSNTHIFQHTFKRFARNEANATTVNRTCIGFYGRILRLCIYCRAEDTELAETEAFTVFEVIDQGINQPGSDQLYGSAMRSANLAHLCTKFVKRYLARAYGA